MDHDHAMKIEAPMKYALGELTETERDSFEEHFADCSQCIADVEAATVFAANAKAVLRERGADLARPKRFAWLIGRPALGFSLALNAALAAILGFAVLRPGAPAANAGGPELVEVVSLRGPTRGAERVIRTAGREVVLQVDLPEHYERYAYSVTQAGSATPERAGELPVQDSGDSLSFRLAAATLKPGEYNVTVRGKTGAKDDILRSCKLVVSKP